MELGRRYKPKRGHYGWKSYESYGGSGSGSGSTVLGQNDR